MAVASRGKAFRARNYTCTAAERCHPPKWVCPILCPPWIKNR